MATLIESESTPLSLRDVAKISQTLAEDMQDLVLRSEGFTVEEYFSLDGNYKVEYVNGLLQILPMPDALHQSLLQWLTIYLHAALAKLDPGTRFQFAPFKVMLDEKRYREPDICVMLGKNAHRRHRTHWDGCDLAIEIISASNAAHDWETKRTDYAAAGIAEYWVIDPDARTLTQFVLEAGQTAYGDGLGFRRRRHGPQPRRRRVVGGGRHDVRRGRGTGGLEHEPGVSTDSWGLPGVRTLALGSVRKRPGPGWR